MKEYHQLAAFVQQSIGPGQAITISRHILSDCTHIPGFTVVDSIMESIVGSAYDIVATDDPRTGHVTFTRLSRPLEDGLHTYVSPDRRHLFERHGLYWKAK